MHKYSLYLELNEEMKVNLGNTNSDSTADAVYSQYVNQVRRGLVKYKGRGYIGDISQVILVRNEDGAEFIYSVKEGFKEIFRKAV